MRLRYARQPRGREKRNSCRLGLVFSSMNNWQVRNRQENIFLGEIEGGRRLTKSI